MDINASKYPSLPYEYAKAKMASQMLDLPAKTTFAYSVVEIVTVENNNLGADQQTEGSSL